MDIQTIIPATGWAAVYEIEGSSVARPLVCWGTNGRKVEGFVVDGGDVVEASNLDGFTTYEYDLDSASMDFLALRNGN
jgi:hypothetical protein